MKQKLKSLQSLLLLLILTVVGTANAWAETPVTWTPTSDDVTTLTTTQGAHIDVGTGSNLFKVYAVRGGGSNKNSDSYVDNEGMKFGDPALYKSGIAVYVPSTSNTISSITFYLRTTNATRQTRYVALNAIGLESEPSCTNQTLTTSYAGYNLFASPAKEKYYVVGGFANGSGDIYLQKIVVTFASGSSTYNVSYNMNGHGTDIDAVEGVAALPNPLPSPTATGYTFGGWYTNSGLTSPATAGASIADDTPLYAKWTLNAPTFSPASGSRINPTDNVTISGIPSSYVYAAWGASAIDAATLTVEGNKKTFNGSGNFTAGASGTGTRVLSARAYDGTLYSDVVSATYYIRTANTLALSTSSGSVTVGAGTLDISGNVTSKNNTSTTVTYTSNDGSVATVSSAGVITPVAAGTTTITVAQVQTDDYTAGSATFTVTVNAAATTYSVDYNGQSPDIGSAPTDTNSPYAAGSNVTVLGNTGGMTKSYKDFVGWNTSTSGTFSTHYNAGATYSSISSDVTFYAVWHNQVTYDVASGSGTVSAVYGTGGDPYYGKSAGAAFTSGDYVPDGVNLTLTATPSTGYQFDTTEGWGGATSTKTATLTDFNITAKKGFHAHFVPKTYTITLDDNGDSSDGSATATYNSNKLTSVSAPTKAGMVVEGYYKEPAYTNKIADASGNLQSSTAYTDASGNWTNDGAVTLYAKWEAAPSSITDLPVTIDFGASPFSTSTDFSGASGKTMSLTQNSHEVYFHGSNITEFSIVSGSPNALRMNSNGATNHFIAIPMSNINGRIDIEVWAPYTNESNFTIRAVLDTDHGTTVQSAAPSAIKTAALDVNDYKDGHFYFRMKDLTATSGVLYIGPASSSYKDYQKIRVTSPAHYLIPDKASVFMGDGSEPETVTITNYSAYPVLVKTVPSYVTATFEPSTGVLVITPKAIGSGGAIELAVDTNGDGEASDVDLSIPVTVTGITNVTAPTSAVYDTSSGSYSPALDALSVTATKSATGNTGTLAYQWYSNTVNSNTGGTVISGATSNTLSTDKISTTDSEKAAFYYCVVSLPGDSCKSVASDVAYVLTSKSKRYFHMSNVAGNRQTSDASEKITGEIVAGGTATAIHGAGSYYRYITRPSTSYPHMYVVSNANNYIKINLKNAIATDDVISVLQMGNQGTSAGIKIATDASGSNAINIYQDGTDTKTYSATFTAAFNGVKEIYILGKYEGHQNYFTDLYISKPAPLAVSAPTPASQIVQSGETPAAFTVTATGGTGSYTYAWKQDTDPSGSFNDDAEGTVVSDGGTSTFTPTSKSVTSNTNYYYKCIVTSGASYVTTSAATLTVTTLTHGYMTIDGTTHEGLTFSFTNGKCTYLTSQDYYNNQNKASATQYTNFWSYSGSGTTWGNKTIGGTEGTYLRLKYSNDKMVFYVKNATAFSFMTTKVDGYTFTVNVDEEEIGTFSTDGNETELISLLKDGSKIEISGPASAKDIYIGHLTFYEKMPATINVLKNGEEVTEATQYMGDGATEYEVETDGDGTLSLEVPAGATPITDGYQTEYVSVTFTDGMLSVTPIKATSTPETITINHTGGTSYADASTTLDVTVKKHTLALAFSYEKASFKASTLTESTVIPSGSLPTLTATVDGEVVDLGTLDIRYKTDDRTIGYFGATDLPASSRSADGTSYAVKYGGGQGGARIYAYVDNQLNPNYSSAKAYFDFVVEAGTSNAIPKSISIDEQQVFKLANSAGVEVVKLTYGGYKYNHEGGWRNSASRGKYYIDGYQYYTRHGMDALDEYGYQLRGMSDEAQAAPSGSESGDKITVTKKKAKKDGSSSVTFDVYKYSSQNVGAHTFWYTEAETRPDGQHYLPYQRIRPFTLPTRGGYLKFEPKQTGKLTVYVWQNGQMESADSSNPDRVGSKPRLGYWFDQNGWVQKPVVAPITKQPITSESFASDVWAGGVRTKMENIWTTTDDIPAINMLTYQYCDNAENPTAYYAESGTGHTDLNPYFWKTRAQVRNNLNEETTIISEKMTPAPYHNGYLVPEESYLKYVINVVAGKSYYFYGMMTKIGYVGMNFVQDDNVTISDTGKKFFHQTTPLHLKADDNMATIVANSVHGDANTYLGSVYDEVTLPSNYKKDQWSTICLPFSLTEEQVEEAFGKGTQLTIYNGAIKKSEGIFSVKYLSHVDRNILAGQPYFIKPTGVDANGVDLENVDGVIGSVVEGASGTRITFNTVCIDSNFSATTTYGSDEDVDKSGSAIGQQGYKFVGAYNNETLPTYSFIVSKGELRRFTGSTSKIPTYYAYLKPNTDAARSGSYSMDVPFTDDTVETAWVIDGGDDPTDVISMEAITDAMNNGRVVTTGKAYNMMGQEIDPTSAKGIVIINGKKYMFE